MSSSLKRMLLGRPLSTAAEKHERLGKVSGLAVFASDALSSVAYGTEEIMLSQTGLVRHRWQHFLHNQTALLLKAALLFRPGKVSVSVPYHLGE